MEPMEIDEGTVVPDTPDKSASQDTVRLGGLKSENWTMSSSVSNSRQFIPPRGIIRSSRSGNHASSSALRSGDSISTRNLLVRKERIDKVVPHENNNLDNPCCMQNKKPLVTFQSASSLVRPGLDLNGCSKERFFQSNLGATVAGEFKKGSVFEDARSSCGRENSPHVLQNVGKERTVSNVVIVDSSPDSVERQNTVNLPKPSRQKRFVRNGCISPMNIAKGKQPVENYKSGSKGMEESDYCPGADTASRDHIPVQNIGDYCSGSSKGKEVLVNNSDGSSELFKARTSASINEKNNRYSANRDSVPSFPCADGWVTTHSQSSQNNFLSPLSRDVHHIPIEDDNPYVVGQASGNKSLRKYNEFDASTGHLAMKPQFSRTNGRSHKAHKTLSKRQKQGSTLSTHAECSRSAADDSEIIEISSPRNDSRSQLTNNILPNAVGNNIVPVINIDEATPEVQHISPHSTGCSSNEDARTTQVELDERMARELQEQFYSEDYTVGTNEQIDAHIALSLQQQEESRRTVSRGRRPVSNPRVSSSGRSASRFPLLFGLTRTHAQAPTPSRVTRTRSAFTGRPHTLSSSRGRNSNIPSSRPRNPVFPAGMDIEARMHILEALESFSDMGVGNSFLQMQRDFNE
ncbi:hypothetical protein LIER_34479 [Lithospermum erythrorhizon]|uniref:Uncharacterized protein n=1 Tax=Lithospermum erythrorhizon TaxID=34254 RepID=A0AAV3RZM7_LITER